MWSTSRNTPVKKDAAPHAKDLKYAYTAMLIIKDAAACLYGLIAHPFQLVQEPVYVVYKRPQRVVFAHAYPLFIISF